MSHIEPHRVIQYVPVCTGYETGLGFNCPSSVLTQFPITMAENSGKDITSLSLSLWVYKVRIIMYLAHRVVVRIKWLTAFLNTSDP